MKSEKLHRLASWCVIGLVVGILTYLFLTKLATVLLPFLFAFFVALLLRPIVLYFCKKSRLSQPSMGILLFFLLVVVWPSKPWYAIGICPLESLAFPVLHLFTIALILVHC